MLEHQPARDTRHRMQIRVLGPLEASIDDCAVSLGGAKQRAVLAMLGLEANRAVTADRLIEGLWGERPPASAAKMVQNYVWRLRTAFDGAAGAEIVTRGRAYELQIDREDVDACRLERLVSDAARAAETGHPLPAAREALALFRGDPLADVADEPFAAGEIRRLEELRLTAEELALEADLAAGRHQEIVGEAEALLDEHPLRERLHAARMLALYRCGRQAEALEAYRDARATLVDEIGVEPGAELRRLHDAVLRQDPELDVELAAAELPRELDAASSAPLAGREEELRQLRARWQRASAGAGSLVVVVGAYGMGKTRTAAELAADVHREGATVLYAGGAGPPEAALAVLAQAREMRRPALVVLDDADRGNASVRAALRELVPVVATSPVLVVATGQEAAALARLEPAETVVLEPLDAGAVREIAAFYAPTGDAGSVPVETLLATSRGVARRVHEAASEWARQEATRRVDAAAGLAAAGRTQATTLEDALAGSVVELQSTRERAGGLPGASEDIASVVCPYKGLASFGAEDAEYFFGRERLVAELVARLVGAPLLAVVGPSGSGKSSVVRAGLLPALSGGVLPGSELWTQAVIRPGSQPLEELRRALRRLRREAQGLLAVDQFEELFTSGAPEQNRAAFIDELVGAARDGIVVVIAVRADFYGRLAAHPELARLAGANHVLVGPMSRDELRRAIERPAHRAGLVAEPELVDALLAEVEGQPGPLPLLSTALLELWRERDGRRLRLAAYARTGGVQGAVARLAEDAYVALDPRGQAAARELLLRLTDEHDDGTLVRRRLALGELGALRDVVAELAGRRLLTVSDGSVEVAHEALLREWPRLRAWLEEDADVRRLHRRLGDAARAWENDGREPSGLARGPRLASALDWAAVHPGELSPLERDFLEESRRAADRAQRRVRAMLAGVGVLAAVALIAGAVALHQRGVARSESTASAAQGLGTQALVDGDLDRSLLLARQGVALDDSPQTRGNLLATLLKTPAAIAVLRNGTRLIGLDASPDGRTIAFIDDHAVLYVMDTVTRRLLAAPREDAGYVENRPRQLDALHFSPDGTKLVVGGLNPVILDSLGRRVLARIATPLNDVAALRFSPDGRDVLALLGNPDGGGYSVQSYDAATGRADGPRRFVSHDVQPPALLLAGAGAHVVTVSDREGVVVRATRTLRPIRRLAARSDDSAALSPDGRTLLMTGPRGGVRFVDLVTRRTRTGAERHAGAVLAAGFSPDGRTAVTAGEDNVVLVWDVRGANVRETFKGHQAPVTGLGFSGDGRTLYTGGLDGKLIEWDLAGDRRLGRPFDTGPDEGEDQEFRGWVAEALSPDGRTLAVGHRHGLVTLVDTRGQEGQRALRVPTGRVRGMAFIPGTPLLAIGGDRGYLALVDYGRGTIVRRLEGLSDPVVDPSVSADGRILIASAQSDNVLIWRLRDGAPTGKPKLFSDELATGNAEVSPDGRRFVVSGPNGIVLVDVATLAHDLPLPGSETVGFVAGFTPDGRGVVGGSVDGWTRVWSVRTGRPISPRLTGHTGPIVHTSVSPDGRTLATGSTDGTVRLYDTETWRPLDAPLPALPGRSVSPRFTPDGAYLLAVTTAGRAYRWDVRPAALERNACAIAGRVLTRAEWAAALPGREYAPACAG